MSEIISTTHIPMFESYLRQEERSSNTIEKYSRDVRAFFEFLSKDAICKEKILEWKERLIQTYAPASVNSMLAALNQFLQWAGVPEYKAKPLKIQRSLFIIPEKELSREEYIRLVRAAEEKHNLRLSMLIQTICATGIRISELHAITVSAISSGWVNVNCKGKRRIIFLPKDLCRKLRHFCKNRGISRGVIFCTKTGAAIDRSNIWREMKALCERAGVQPVKVFPHNLRHLFARTYYQLEKDISKLADLLGHSSITTTRIYTAESGTRHAEQLNHMGLVLT